jgi:DNA-directed RNA polymerase specialized sigma24 family protein
MNGSPADDVTSRPFQYVLDNQRKIKAILLKQAYGDKDLAELMFSEVVLERIHRIFELYDGVRPLENYVLNAIRWYAFKYANKHRRTMSYETLAGANVSYDTQTLEILDGLSEIDRYLLTAHVLYEMTMQEIADELDWSVPSVSSGIKKAKEALWNLIT